MQTGWIYSVGCSVIQPHIVLDEPARFLHKNHTQLALAVIASYASMLHTHTRSEITLLMLWTCVSVCIHICLNFVALFVCLFVSDCISIQAAAVPQQRACLCTPSAFIPSTRHEASCRASVPHLIHRDQNGEPPPAAPPQIPHREP